MATIDIFKQIAFCCSLISDGDASFQWINDCYYNGNDFETKYGVKSFMRCAENCFNNTNCNYFTFGAQISLCSLKHFNDSSQAVGVSSKGSICGMIPDRIITSKSTLAAGRQWRTSQDGSFKWASNCHYLSFDIPTAIPVANVTVCGRYCQANVNCNFFSFRMTDNYCLPKKTNGLYTSESTMTTGFSCGFITDRKYNVETLMTSNCD